MRFLEFDRAAFVAIAVVLGLGTSNVAAAPPGAAGDVAAPDVAAAPSEPAAASKATFDVWEFDVEGNTVLRNLDIERVLYPFLGPGRAIDDVEGARAALEKTYRDTGFLTVFVDIPEQEVKDGLVRLQVTEGKVSRYAITGNRYFARGYIRARTPELAIGSVPDFREVQREITALGNSADRQLTPVLSPGRAPGEVQIEMRVVDKRPLHGSIELNNRQTPNTEPLRLTGSLRYDNLWQRGHSLSGTFQTAPEDPGSLKVFSGTYAVPVGTKGGSLAIYGVSSNSDLAVIGTTGVIGKGNIVGARYGMPLKGSETYSHSLSFGIDYKSFDESVRLGVDSIVTPIDYTPLVVQYRGTRASTLAVHSGGISFNTAPRAISGNDDSEFANKRARANASYMYLRGDWLSEYLLTKRDSLRLRVQGQYTVEPIIAYELMYAGGVDSVRGYLEAEVLADTGIIGSLELQRRLVSDSTGWINGLTVLAFTEGAQLRGVYVLPGQQPDFNLLSVGVGARLQLQKTFQSAVALGLPLTDGNQTKRYDPRLHFSVSALF